VAIALFVKQKSGKRCKVFHTDLYGLREIKYDWLDNNTLEKKITSRFSRKVLITF